MMNQRGKGLVLTVLLLNVSMTFSPPSLDANAISTMMNGCVLTISQPTISPPTGVIALSISAAVVPGAKFCAMTAKGPASPRIVMPASRVWFWFWFWALPPFFTMLTWRLTESSVSMRSKAAVSRATFFLAAAFLAAAAPGRVTRELRGALVEELTELCRS